MADTACDHQHGENCYHQALSCDKAEAEAHAHSDGCYTETQTCVLAEHSHDGGCNNEGGELACTQDEHSHDESCNTREPICTQAETESHSHTDDCYTETLDCQHVHHETCGGLAPAVPECSCGALPDADGNTAHTEGCALYVPEQTPPAVCETCGEAHETADCPVEAVRALMAALPTPEAIAAMTEDERTASGAYEKMDAAYNAYDALTAAQKALLPDAMDTFTALQGALGAAPVTLAGETYPIVISAKWASPAYICAGGTPLVIEKHTDSTFNMTYTTVYIDTNGNGVVDNGELSLKEAGIKNAPEDNDTLNGYSIYGGGYNSTTKIEKTQITMNGGQVSYIYGGGGGSGSTGTVGTTNVTMNGGQVDGNICGGGNNGCVAANTNVTIKGGTVKDSVYGGNGANDTAQVTTGTTILIEGGRIDQSVLGGSGKGTPVATTSITVRGTGVVKMYVRGANSGEVDGGKTSITIGGGAKVGAWAYHSGVYLYDETKPTNVQRFTISPALTGRVQVVLSDTYDASSEPTIATGAVEGDSGKIELYDIYAENYVTYFKNGTIKVKPKVLVTEVSLDKAELTFTLNETAAQQLTATVTPADADNKTVTWKSSDISIATVNASGLVTAVGKGTAIITATAGSKTATCAVTVKLPEIPNKDTITVTAYGGSYDGAAHELVTVTGAPEGSTITYSRTGGADSYSTTMPTLTDAYTAASVWVKVSCAGYEDYFTNVEATIARVLLTPSIDMSGYTPREYDGTTAAAGAKITLTGKIVSGETPTATATSVTFDTADAGENKTVSATGIALESSNGVNKNYVIYGTELSDQPSMAKITPKPAAVVWNVPTLTYTGTSLADEVAAKYVDVENQDIPLAVSFGEGATFQNAGTYTATATTATMTTANGNYTLTDITKEVTIGKAASIITLPKESSVGVTSVTLNAATTDVDGAITYGYSTANDVSKVTDWQSDLTFSGLTSGTTYYFFARSAEGTNYFAAQSNALEVQTTAKSLTGINVTTPPTKTAYQAFETFDKSGMVVTASYDDGTSSAITEYTFSYPDDRTSFRVSDTAVTITHGGKETTQAVTVNPAAGSGSVTLDGWTYGDTAKDPVPTSTTNGTTSVSYQYKVKDAEDATYVSIVPTDAGTYSVKAEFTATDNYTAATATAEFTIAPRPVTITATEQTVVYGTAISQGAEHCARPALVSGHTLDSITLTTDNTDVTTDGQITPAVAVIKNGDADVTKNYVFTYAPGKLIINPDTNAEVKVGLVTNTFTYKGSDHNLAIQKVTVNGAETNDYSLLPSPQKDAGEYTLTVEITEGNYKGSTGTAPYTIQEKDLDVTPTPSTITYGDAPTSADVTYDGFADGENESVLTGVLEYTYTYEQFGTVGSYAITPKGLTAKNYEIQFKTGTLTVVQKEVGLTWTNPDLVYDGTDKAPTVTATGTVNNDALVVNMNRTNGDGKSAGTHTYTATGLTGDKNVNYKLPSVLPHTVTIAPRAYGDGTGFTTTKIPDQPYTGVEIKPEPEILYNGVALVRGTDYEQTLAYANNRDKGTDTASVTATLTGNYSGSVTVNFSIVDNPLDESAFEEVVGVTKAELATWHNADIVLTAKDGWTIGMSVDSLGSTITLSKEGAASTDTFYAKASDGQVYQATVIYALDKSVPTISEPTGNPTVWTNQSAEISFTAADTLSGVASVTVMSDGTVYETTENKSFVADRNGDYVITATDTAGNTKTETVKIDKIDTTAPTASIALAAEAPDSGWFTSTVTVTVTAADDHLQKWQYTTDGSTWQDGADDSFTISANGDYVETVKVKAIDEAGNETVSNIISVKLDKTTPAAPTLTVVAGDSAYTPGEWTAKDVAFTLSGGETISGLAKYQVKIGAADWADVGGSSYTVSTNTAGDGGITYQFRAVNNAGTDGTADIGTLVKRRALDDSILDSEDNKYATEDMTPSGTQGTNDWFTGDVTVTVAKKGTLADNNAKTYYTVDGGAKTELTGATIPLTTDGTHTLVIWTEDAAGNETTHLTTTVKIDKTAPTIDSVSITATPGLTEPTTQPVVITIPVVDDGSGMRSVTVTPSENITVTGPVDGKYTVTVTENGSYTIIVTDNAGNTATTTQTVTGIDRTKPTVTVTPETDSGKWYGKTELTVTATDPDGTGVASTVITVDGKAVNSPISITEKGEHIVVITVTDAAGNLTTITKTINVDPAIDTFKDAVDSLGENPTIEAVQDVLDNYLILDDDAKTHIQNSDIGKDAWGDLQDELKEQQDAIKDKIGGILDKENPTISDINDVENLFDILDKDAQDKIDKGKLDQLIKDRDVAQTVADQLQNADAYEEQKAAVDAYDRLTEGQKKLADGILPPNTVADMKNVISKVGEVISLIDNIKKPYTPATKDAIEATKDAYDALNEAQKNLLPSYEKEALDSLLAQSNQVKAVEDKISALTKPYAQSENATIKEAQNVYNKLTADEKSMVDKDRKVKLDELYKSMLDAIATGNAAADKIIQDIIKVENDPSHTVEDIQRVEDAYNKLPQDAKDKVDQTVVIAPSTTAGNILDQLVQDKDTVKDLVNDLGKLDPDKLTPGNVADINKAGTAYEKLTEDQKHLVDNSTGGKLPGLVEAVEDAKEVEEAIKKIPGHTGSTTNSDGTPDLGHCDNSGNGNSDNTGTGGHNTPDHRKAIEDAKYAYELLSDAGRRLIAADAVAQLNSQYKALMSYLEYINRKEVSGATVEVVGLAEKVDAPPTSPGGKTVIAVELKVEEPPVAIKPTVPAGKTQALSVDVKLVATELNGDGTELASQQVQPASGKVVLVKLLLPTGYELDTLEIVHIKDSGAQYPIHNFHITTEDDGGYAVFEVSSFSHFVFFAEKVAVPPTPPTPDDSGDGDSGGDGSNDNNPGGTSYKPNIPTTENGSVTVTPAQPKPGTNVAVTPKPDEGYVVDKIVVTDQNGKDIPVKDNGDGTYSYTQPNSKVTVTVTFKPASKAQDLPFADVGRGDWFYDSVKYVYEKGLMNGTSGTAFSPYLTTSRGMIVTTLWRLEGEPTATDTNPFADVTADKYYAAAIAWGAENGIVKGYGNGNFGPNDPITREQLASILYRYAQFKGMDTTAKGNMAQFSDQPSSWATESVQWSVGADLISGKGNGVLDPLGQATRAETAKILANFVVLSQD